MSSERVVHVGKTCCANCGNPITPHIIRHGGKLRYWTREWRELCRSCGEPHTPRVVGIKEIEA